MSKKWYDPKKILPDTEDGEWDENVVRVFVVVETSDGEKYRCQFRRRNRESGGLFCGLQEISKPSKKEKDKFYFGERLRDFYLFGETSIKFGGAEIVAWRYEEKISRCGECGHKAKVREIDGYWYVTCKYCANFNRAASPQAAIKYWNEAQK